MQTSIQTTTTQNKQRQKQKRIYLNALLSVYASTRIDNRYKCILASTGKSNEDTVSFIDLYPSTLYGTILFSLSEYKCGLIYYTY